MEMLFGLPAHPLITHFPVVAVPLISIAAIFLVLRPSKIEGHALLVAGFSILTAISTILAASSGEAFAELVGSGDAIDKHRQLGETLRLISVVQAVSITAMLAVHKKGASKVVGAALSAAVVITSVLALIWVIRTGHEGASQTWRFFTS